MILIGVVVGYFIFVGEIKRNKLDYSKSLSLVFWLLLGVFFGSRAFFQFGPWNQNEISFLQGILKTFIPWMGSGYVMLGGATGGILAAWIYLKIHKMHFFRYMDLLSISSALAMVFGRFGCFFAFDHPTTATSLPWALQLGEQSFHPTMIYASIFYFLLFLFLMSLNRNKLYDGQIFLTTMVLFPLARFLMEFTRIYDTLFFGLSASQIISLTFLVIFVPMYYHFNNAIHKKVQQKPIKMDFLLFSISGVILIGAVYFVSAWNYTYSFILFVLGLILLLHSIFKTYSITFKTIKSNDAIKNLVVIGVTLIILFSLSAVIQRVVGSTLDKPYLQDCPHKQIGNNESNIYIMYFESPYCTLCWQNEIFVFPKLEENMIDEYYMEHFDIRHCSEISSSFGIYGTPGYVMENTDTGLQFIYYGFRSYEQIKRDIEELKKRE
tara:strand:- start:674 stop:1984 length:1311 start_codon:yes stop_codon:yes gene_type:complete